MGKGEGLGGCYSCIKYLMFAFNLLFWLLGCALIGVAIWVLVDPRIKEYTDNAEAFQRAYTAAYILIATGVIVMIIGFLGCCGAIRESQCMLATFFICLLVIFVALIGVGIYAVAYKSKFRETVYNTLESGTKNYYSDPSSKALMDAVQTNLGCCGYKTGGLDYFPNKPSTCELVNTLKPCVQGLYDFFADHLMIIAGVAIGIGCIMGTSVMVDVYYR